MSYTSGMKTAISLPDRVFKQAQHHARRTGKTRSRLYAEAVAEYLLRHAPDEITERMNEVCAANDSAAEADFARTAARKILEKEKW